MHPLKQFILHRARDPEFLIHFVDSLFETVPLEDLSRVVFQSFSRQPKWVMLPNEMVDSIFQFLSFEEWYVFRSILPLLCIKMIAFTFGLCTVRVDVRFVCKRFNVRCKQPTSRWYCNFYTRNLNLKDMSVFRDCRVFSFFCSSFSFRCSTISLLQHLLFFQK